MKFLAFLFSTWLLSATAQAQTAPATGTQAPINIGPAPSWGGVIDRYAKEGIPETADSTDAKLTTETYSEQERAAKRAAARPPAKGALAPAAAGAAEKPPKPGQEDEFSKSVTGTVKDLVKPFQEVLQDQSAEKRQEGDPLARPERDGQGQQPFGSNAQAAQPRGQNDRQQEKLRTDHMLAELVEELKPWAIGAALLAFVGFCVNLWLSYAKRKTQRTIPSTSASRSGPPSAYSTGTPRSHLETDPGRSSSRKSRSRS